LENTEEGEPQKTDNNTADDINRLSVSAEQHSKCSGKQTECTKDRGKAKYKGDGAQDGGGVVSTILGFGPGKKRNIQRKEREHAWRKE